MKMDRPTLATVFAYVLTQLVEPMGDHIADSDIVKMYALLSANNVSNETGTKRRCRYLCHLSLCYMTEHLVLASECI